MAEPNDTSPYEFQVCFTRELTPQQLIKLLLDRMNDGWSVARQNGAELVFSRPISTFAVAEDKHMTMAGRCLVCMREIVFVGAGSVKTKRGIHASYLVKCSCGADNSLAVYSDLGHVQQTARRKA